MECVNCENLNCLIKKNISSKAVQQLILKKNTIACKKGQQFVIEDAPINGLFFIYKGKSKVIKTGIYGKEQILRLVTQGEIIGHRGFVTRKKYSIGALAIEDSILCNFSTDILNAALLETPKLAYDFMLFYADELDKSEAKVKKLAQMTVREKVIDTLLYIYRKFSINSKGYLAVKLSRKEIADYAGTTDEQVIRVLSLLKKESFIQTSGKQIKILDIEKLKKEISEHNFFYNS
jgi:CRP-like cAMP-binding protein